MKRRKRTNARHRLRCQSRRDPRSVEIGIRAGRRRRLKACVGLVRWRGSRMAAFGSVAVALAGPSLFSSSRAVGCTCRALYACS